MGKEKDEEEESSFSGASQPQGQESPPPTSNLKRFHGATGLLEFVQRRRGSSHDDNNGDAYLESDDDRFFDSRDYRCCCAIFHAKIGTFVFCTWIFHEIVLGTIYLLTQLEAGSELTSRMALLLACRFIQLTSMAVLYVGLWRHQRFLLLPFALVQMTLGTFVDISTLMMLLERHQEAPNAWLFHDPSTKWLNVVLPLLLYTAIQVSLMWVLYKCFVFLKARSAHDEKRRLDKQKEQAKLHTHTSSANVGASHPLIQRTLSDRVERVPLGSGSMVSDALHSPKASTSPPEAVGFRVNHSSGGGEAREEEGAGANSVGANSALSSRASSPHTLILNAAGKVEHEGT